MIVADLEAAELRRRLRHEGLRLEMGPFVVNVRTPLSRLEAQIRELHANYRIAEQRIANFHISVDAPRRYRRWLRPQAQFFVDGYAPFTPLPQALGFPALEWGINWCIATRSNQYLMLHCAVVERSGLAMLFPAWPGHGKSTLCTALVHSGWRLLSDEFGIVRPGDTMMLPLPRLIPLKNQSIDVIRRFAPRAVIGPSFYGTRKGTIAHVQPPPASLRDAQVPARPRWLVFPRWRPDGPLELEPMSQAGSFLMVATNAFNYEVLGATAYQTVRRMIDTCNCYRLSYTRLEEAIAALDRLAEATDE